MASDLDSSSRGATSAPSQPGVVRGSSPSSSGVREALRSFARDGARVVVLTGETNRQRFVVHPGAPAQRFRIGCSAECNWTVDAPGVAPLHLELHWDGGELFVTPLGGCTVLLNGATHRHRVRIMGDTRMQVGEAEVALWVGAEPRPDEQASPSRPPQAFHVARPPRLIDDASRTRTAMGMVSPLLAAWQAKNEADAAARATASDAPRPDRRTEPFYVGGLSTLEDAAAGTHPGADRSAAVSTDRGADRAAAGVRSLFDTERSEPWPEPPMEEHERDGAHLLVPPEAPSAPRLARGLAVQTTAELALPPHAALVREPAEPPAPAVSLASPQGAVSAPDEPSPQPVTARTTPVPPWEDPAEIAPPAQRPRAKALPLPTASLPLVRAVRIPEDTRGTTMPAMRVLTSELTVVDPSARPFPPKPSTPVATPRPAPQEPSSQPPLGSLPAPRVQAAPSALPPADPWLSHVSAGAVATQSMPMDTAWPVPPPAGPPPGPAIRNHNQARFLDPLPAPQPERPLLATSAALRERYLRDREAEWETPSAAALERPRVSVLSHPRAARGGPQGRLYWLGIALALVGMSAAPLAIPELREDARELLRRGLRTVSSLVGRDARLDRALPPRPPRAPEITERVR